jgi:hypothetical protein
VLQEAEQEGVGENRLRADEPVHDHQRVELDGPEQQEEEERRVEQGIPGKFWKMEVKILLIYWLKFTFKIYLKISNYSVNIFKYQKLYIFT